MGRSTDCHGHHRIRKDGSDDRRVLPFFRGLVFFDPVDFKFRVFFRQLIAMFHLLLGISYQLGVWPESFKTVTDQKIIHIKETGEIDESETQHLHKIPV